MEIIAVPGIDIAKNTINMAEVVLTGVSGKQYRPTMKLTAGRLTAWEASWYKAKHGMAAKDGLKSWLEVREWMKKGDNYEASQIVGKEIDVTARIADLRPNPIMELLTYFLNTPDEDVSEIDDEQVKQKLHDLRYYDSDGLFLLAGTLMPALPHAYIESKVDILVIMELAKKMQIKNLQSEKSQNDADK